MITRASRIPSSSIRAGSTRARSRPARRYRSRRRRTASSRATRFSTSPGSSRKAADNWSRSSPRSPSKRTWEIRVAGPSSMRSSSATPPGAALRTGVTCACRYPIRKYAARMTSTAVPTCSGWNSALTWRFAVCRRTPSASALCPGNVTEVSFSMLVSTKTMRIRPSPIASAYAATREKRALAWSARTASRTSRVSSGWPGCRATSGRTDSASAPS